MTQARLLLPQYYGILENERTARYLDCKHTPTVFNPKARTEDLWKIHTNTLKNPTIKNTIPSQSLLDLKIELANRIYQNCYLCERRCTIDRRTQTGDCGVQHAQVASEFLHLGEEPPLVPSYTIFFSGCTFHCVFCQNWDISQHHTGHLIKPSILAEMIQKRHHQGAKNVNWVGGDPTSNLPYILTVLKHCTTNLPQVWNSNMYCSTETMSLLNGVIDVYLTDYKYGNDTCAKRLSHVNNYTQIIQRNHQLAYQQAEIIIRHLVMPHHTTCCSTPILHWIHNNTPNALVNIMPQYRPEYHALDYDDINIPVTKEEYTTVKNLAQHLNLYEI
ncbi:MAG: 4Fe-4S cluster-binding domain-containing protein [Methanobacteriota archaeon]